MDKETALKVLDEVKTKFAGYQEAFRSYPVLFDGTHEDLSEDAWVISWEEGPYEWAYTAWPTAVQGAFVEPVNSFTLGVFPE